MEAEIFMFFLFGSALTLSQITGIQTDRAINKLSGRCVGEKPTWLFGRLCGLFFGVYGFFLPAVYGGSYGALWGVLVSALAFPVFAFSIVFYVRLKESLQDRCHS